MTGVDNMTGWQPCLDDVDMGRLLRALESGTRVRDVATAFGLSTRTVYRYMHARIVNVDVDGYELVFLCRRGLRPVELTRRHRAKVL